MSAAQPYTSVEEGGSFPRGGTEEQVWEFLLRYAVRAPSGHNTQPWRFQIADGRLRLYADRGRALSVVDPEERELVMSCGAALAHLTVAFRHFGYAGDVSPFLDAANRDLLATVSLGQAHTPQPGDHQLFEAIEKRHTHRATFETRPVPHQLLAQLGRDTRRAGATLHAFTEDDHKAAIATTPGARLGRGPAPGRCGRSAGPAPDVELRLARPVDLGPGPRPRHRCPRSPAGRRDRPAGDRPARSAAQDPICHLHRKEARPCIPLEIEHVTNRYNREVVVDDLSLTVAPGRVTGFLGPNGAGKSTTMKILLDLAAADSGHGSISGTRYRDLEDPARTVEVVLEPNAFHPGRSGRNHLRILADGSGIPPARIDELLEMVELSHAADRPVGGYSLGMRQRLGVAAALLGDPPVLVLDKPATASTPKASAGSVTCCEHAPRPAAPSSCQSSARRLVPLPGSKRMKEFP